MRIWTPGNIDKIRKKKGMSFLGFMRKVRRGAAGTKRLPSDNHVRNIINGSVPDPGVGYAGLFADALECKTDDFFVEKEPKRRKR